MIFHETPVDTPRYNLGNVRDVETIIDWFIKAGNYEDKTKMMEVARKLIRNKLKKDPLPQ